MVEMELLPDGALVNAFSKLGPRDLASLSCVSRRFRALTSIEKAANLQWRHFYSARWKVQLPVDAPVSWQQQYGRKMSSLRAWSGRYAADHLYGHKAGVRAIKLLPQHNLLATGSLDRTVRLWDLSSGLPVCSSRPHGGTVRCLALGASALASGSSDAIVRVWEANPRPLHNDASDVSDVDLDAVGDQLLVGASPPPSPSLLFDVSRPPLMLRGHTGPISCMCLSEAPDISASGHSFTYTAAERSQLYTGSWDCSVRLWTPGDDGASASSGSGSASHIRSSTLHGSSSSSSDSESEDGDWVCRDVLRYNDWVYCTAARGELLLVSSGSEVLVHDRSNGQVIRKFAELHEGYVSCLEASRCGRLLLTAAADGLVMAHDLRMKRPSRVLWHHNAGVAGLAFEDPWVATAGADGTIMLINTDSQPATRGLGANCRQLQCPGGPPLCVDLCDQWLAAGCDAHHAVRTFDFTGAAEAQRRADEARAVRALHKQARQQAKSTSASMPTASIPIPNTSSSSSSSSSSVISALRPSSAEFKPSALPQMSCSPKSTSPLYAMASTKQSHQHMSAAADYCRPSGQPASQPLAVPLPTSSRGRKQRRRSQRQGSSYSSCGGHSPPNTSSSSSGHVCGMSPSSLSGSPPAMPAAAAVSAHQTSLSSPSMPIGQRGGSKAAGYPRPHPHHHFSSHAQHHGHGHGHNNSHGNGNSNCVGYQQSGGYVAYGSSPVNGCGAGMYMHAGGCAGAQAHSGGGSGSGGGAHPRVQGGFRYIERPRNQARGKRARKLQAQQQAQAQGHVQQQHQQQQGCANSGSGSGSSPKHHPLSGVAVPTSARASGIMMGAAPPPPPPPLIAGGSPGAQTTSQQQTAGAPAGAGQAQDQQAMWHERSLQHVRGGASGAPPPAGIAAARLAAGSSASATDMGALRRELMSPA